MDDRKPAAAAGRLLRIGELAALAGLTPRAVRFYHACGLLAEPVRSPAGYRLYDGMALAQAIRIRRLRELGLTVDQVRELLTATPPGDLQAALDALRAELASRAEALRRACQAIDQVQERIRDQQRAASGQGEGQGEGAAAWQRLLATVRAGHAAGRSGDVDARLEAIVASSPALATLGDRLEQLQHDPAWQRVSQRLAALQDAPADDAAVDGVAAELARMLPAELLPDELADPAAVVLLLGARFSPAQLRCLHQARHHARGRLPPQPPTPGGPTGSDPHQENPR